MILDHSTACQTNDKVICFAYSDPDEYRVRQIDTKVYKYTTTDD